MEEKNYVCKQTAAARNDVIAKKIASGLFQNLSGRPEDWTVSGPCHLYSTLQPLITPSTTHLHTTNLHNIFVTTTQTTIIASNTTSSHNKNTYRSLSRHNTQHYRR